MSYQQSDPSDQNPTVHFSAREGEDLLHSPERGTLTLGQLEQLLSTSSTVTDKELIFWLAALSQLGSSETAWTFSHVAAKNRTHAAAEKDKLDWGLFFSALRREELTEAVIDQTTMSHLSDLLWQRHTAP